MDRCPECEALLPAEATTCKCGWSQVPRGAAPYHRPFAARQVYREPTPIERANINRFRDKMKQLLSRPKPHPKAWAHRILERRAQGERFSPYIIESALEVVGKRGLPAREPGEDDA